MLDTASGASSWGGRAPVNAGTNGVPGGYVAGTNGTGSSFGVNRGGTGPLAPPVNMGRAGSLTSGGGGNGSSPMGSSGTGRGGAAPSGPGRGGAGFGGAMGGTASGMTSGGASAGRPASPATAGSAGSVGGGEPAPGGAAQPQIPAIDGTCPNFMTGTATIGGLSGISLQVGAKKEGTGALLFYWHGTGSSASEVNRLVPAAVREEILGDGGIIVSFQSSLGTGGDCSGTSTFSKDDFKVADLIAACAVRDHGIDPRRIYTTGCSAGGLQAGCMGALRSSYIAATAPNSGGEVTRQPIQDASRTPAVMTMHGGTSDRVIVSFSSTSATYDSHMKGAGSFVVNCDHGGGHCAASATLYTAAWEFMKAHPFGVEPSPYSAGLPSSFPSFCKVF